MMLSPVRLVVAVGLAQAGRADQVCDFEHRCYENKPPGQTYHMDLAHPDLETPAPAPEYPAPSAVQGRSITVQPSNAAPLVPDAISVPNIEPLIVELCPVSPEERALRERADMNPPGR